MDSPQAEALSGAPELDRVMPQDSLQGAAITDIATGCPPSIASIKGDDRPFWSVMIPAYNPDPAYLAQALRGVIAAGIGEGEMQIEVLDNASANIDVAALVQSVAEDRVTVIRHAENIRPLANWNACIARAKGEWVHILHADDVVLPRFYANMRSVLDANADLGAAFCRYAHINGAGEPIFASDPERVTPGVLEDCLQRLAVMPRVQSVSIVVRRAVYEKLGGFWSALGSSADWEMWMRIFASYPVGYHPELLACRRVHPASGSALLRESATSIADAGKAIDIAGAYLPAGQREELVRLGKQHHARSAFQIAVDLIKEQKFEAALIHIDEGLKLDPTPERAQMAEQIIAQMAVSETPAKEDVVEEGQFFGVQEALNLEQMIKSYQENPTNASASSDMQALRQGLANFLVQAEIGGLKELLASNFGRIYRLFLKSGFQNELLTPEETETAEKFGRGLGKENFDLRELLAYMLFRMAHHGFTPFALERIPGWFRDDYLAYVLYAPQMFLRKGESEQYCAHATEWARVIHRRIRNAQGASLTYEVAKYFTLHANAIPLYFVASNTKEYCVKRAAIIEFVLEKSGNALGYKFPAPSANRSKLRVGFLNAHFASTPETWCTVSALYLDRSKFDVRAFTLSVGGGPTEDFVRAQCDEFVHLPSKLVDQVAIIRKAALDVLLIGTNITAVTNQIALLAVHRLAPSQLLLTGSPVSSGMKHVDGYILGNLFRNADLGGYFTEKLFPVDGPVSCFDLTHDVRPAQVHFDRKQLGIPADAIVFVSGANCFKILPELMETWAKILKSVDDSILLLAPFNPNWSSVYPVRQFERSMAECFARHGLDINRLILSNERLTTPRADIRELLKIGDIYLDSYPYAGATSLMDPLDLGIPPVVWEEDTLCSQMAATLLRDIQLTELIASDEEEYIGIALKLARDGACRTRLSNEIRAKMLQIPRSIDCRAYSIEIGKVIESVAPKLNNVEPKGKSPVQPPPVAPMPNEDLIDTAIRLHTEGQYAQAEELYRQILTANPHNPDAWNLLGVLAHQCGNDDSAVEFIEQALLFIPDNAVFLNNLAEAHRTKGDNAKAIEYCRRALELQPDFAEVMVTLANALRATGGVGEAMPLFAKALQLKPNYAEGLVQYGLALYGEKRIKEAVAILKRACIAAPDSVEPRYHLGVALEASEHYADALTSYEKASKLNANVGEVWNRWGRLLTRLKEFSKAVVILKEALRCNADDPDYNYNYGHALQMLQHTEEALVHFEIALAKGGNTPELHNNTGVIYKELRRYFDAAESFHRALSLKPDMIPALNNLGAVCTDMGLTSEALECVQLLIAKSPNIPSAHNNLGKLLKDSGRAAEAIAPYKRAMELDPNIPDVQHNYLLCLNYLADRNPVESFNAHRAWGERMARKYRGQPDWRSRNGDPDRKLRIGYVSADFCQHPVAMFIVALFAKHDRKKFEVVAYSDVKAPDAVTERLQELADIWRDTRELSHQAMAKMIRDDQIDILIDLGGHTAWTRLEMFAMKPAPVQVSYLGYPATTGLAAMDYRITDGLADPVGTTEHLHTERLVHLPACAWCYQAPKEAPAVGVLASAQNGYVTFGCFNNLAKLNSTLYDLWIRLLQRVPGSHLKLKARTLYDPTVRRDLIQYFVERGIDESRLEILGFAATQAGHLEEYQRVDIALDSYPYHGTTTTCEALWMGVPVVTLAGEVHVSRVGVSLLTAVGLPDLIASTPEEYIETAVRLAEDGARLTALRAGMRGRMQASPLMDRTAFAAGMDDAFRKMWKEHVSHKSNRK